MLARALARPCAALALGARVRSRVGPIHRHVTTRASASSASSNDADTSLVLFAPTLRATERVAAMLASDAGRGDVLCLHGEVGAGKSALSRAYVRAVCGDPYVEVPSPTFLLQQVYDDHCGADTSTGPPPVHHFDLYRLTGPEDCDRLGLEESFTAASSLIEWAERLGERCPGERLDVYIEARAGVGEEASGREMGAVVVEVKTSEEDEDDDDDEEDEDADPAFVDRKPRVIRLVPRGEAWRRRVDALAAKLS